MTTFAGLAPVRDDFRCYVCRQKGVFHCEHDTPYRDQYLGTNEQEKPPTTHTNSRKEHQRAGVQNNTNSTNYLVMQNINTGRNTNSNAGGRHQQGSRPTNHSAPNTNTSHAVKNHEQKKEKKSCVIL